MPTLNDRELRARFALLWRGIELAETEADASAAIERAEASAPLFSQYENASLLWAYRQWLDARRPVAAGDRRRFESTTTDDPEIAHLRFRFLARVSEPDPEPRVGPRVFDELERALCAATGPREWNRACEAVRDAIGRYSAEDLTAQEVERLRQIAREVRACLRSERDRAA